MLDTDQVQELISKLQGALVSNAKPELKAVPPIDEKLN